jgi:hypothetical protein
MTTATLTATNDTSKRQNQAEDAAAQNAAASSVADQPAPKKNEKIPRTSGNKVFDLLVYPSIAFGAVFTFSVWFVQQATHGTGWAHNQFNKLKDFFENHYTASATKASKSLDGIPAKARGTAMMLVSFLGGTALVMPIKWFEQYRSQFSHWYDEKFAKVHPDPKAYEQEPVQSFSSIAAGRATTFGVVVGIDQIIGKRIDKITDSAGEYITQWRKKKPGITAEKAAKAGQWAKVLSYEGFYTFVCATLLYIFSRGIAGFFNSKEAEKESDINTTNTANDVVATPAPAQKPTIDPNAVAANDANYKQDISPKQPSPSGKVSDVNAGTKVAAEAPLKTANAVA